MRPQADGIAKAPATVAVETSSGRCWPPEVPAADFLFEKGGELSKPQRVNLASVLEGFTPEAPTALVKLEHHGPVTNLEVGVALKVVRPDMAQGSGLGPCPQQPGHHVGRAEPRGRCTPNRELVPKDVQHRHEHKLTVSASGSLRWGQRCADLLPFGLGRYVEATPHRSNRIRVGLTARAITEEMK